MPKKLTEEQILKRRASQKLYYLKIRKKKLAYCKNRYNEKSEKILAQQANYRAENRDVINAKQRARYHEKRLAEKLAILQGNNL
jgi:hypothetical protein